MNLQHRIDLLTRLGKYMISDDPFWLQVKSKASIENRWFMPQFIDLAVNNIAHLFLSGKVLTEWTKNYDIPSGSKYAKKVGIVMAGNIPLVGLHDLISVFISGHDALIKPSSKDEVLIKHLVEKLIEWDYVVNNKLQFADRLNGCDAYITTGSNNSSRYFEYYFGKYPHIIRRNKTSVALITGNEFNEDLEKLADDVFTYFGLGCRNVTKLYVPAHYDFVPLLDAFKKYSYLIDHNSYKNNYDHILTLHILNNRFYMTNGCILLVEDNALFSPVSQLNFEYYSDKKVVLGELKSSQDIQLIVGRNMVPFGEAQCPTIFDYADNVDTILFLTSL